MRCFARGVGMVLGGLIVIGMPARARAGEGEGDERILALHADIAVAEDASLLVTETIRVRAAGATIRHGIFRDFPTRALRGLGIHRVGFEVTSAFRDGAPERFRVGENEDLGTRVYLGREDELVSPGAHTYVLSYRTDRQLRFFGDHDELYWNVTGNDWPLPIDEASAEVHLPAAASGRVGEVTGYTGPRGSTARDLVASRLDGGARFVSTRPLRAHDGLTIVTTWPKGVVREPTAAERRAAMWRDNHGLLFGLAGLLAQIAFLAWAWRRVGPDLPAGPPRPLVSPPRGLSPGALRYVSKMWNDSASFAAALADMAERGYLTIARLAKSAFELARTGKDEATLPAEERAIARALFAGDAQRRRLDRSDSRAIDAARKAFDRALRDELGTRYFARNLRWGLPGLLLSLAVGASLVIGLTTPRNRVGLIVLALFATGSSALATAVVRFSRQTWREQRAKGRGFWSAVRKLASTIIGVGIVLVIALVFALLLAMLVAPGAALLIVASGAAAFLPFVLLPRATAQGRELLDEIAGYRAYLARAQVPGHLAYAMALDVDLAASALAVGVAAIGAVSSAPPWYWEGGDDTSSRRVVGPGQSGFDLSDFTSSLSSAVSSSSSSGSSGGSSGGGGGGGGGGGW